MKRLITWPVLRLAFYVVFVVDSKVGNVDNILMEVDSKLVKLDIKDWKVDSKFREVDSIKGFFDEEINYLASLATGFLD